ncbi:hypothetical protein VNO80_00983 [Phaseolus coccineus]|uniref:phospholipase D n=1 Tax=Phaseolus coccineus TaxID=3886 RepID=A0AAN9RRC4_PHACN
MYDSVARELKTTQLTDEHPQDYLNFYCLDNGEDFNEESSSTNGAQTVNENDCVHAKGMIIDDEYVIIGSANINQRAMAALAMDIVDSYMRISRENDVWNGLDGVDLEQSITYNVLDNEHKMSESGSHHHASGCGYPEATNVVMRNDIRKPF